MTEGAGNRKDRKQCSRYEGNLTCCVTELIQVERQHRAKGTIHQLQAEDHTHQKQDVLERQDVPKGNPPRFAIPMTLRATWLFVEDRQNEERESIESSGNQEGVPQSYE